MDKLKPCPFCGSSAELHKIGCEYYVDCNLDFGNCPCIPHSWHFETPEEAAEAWNTRKGEKE